MAGRRTKKQKQNAKYNFISWKPESKDVLPEANKTKIKANVKRENFTSSEYSHHQNPAKKTADNMALYSGLGTVRKGIIKSITLAGLILALELVLYLIL